jgi:hypothetical protein
LKPTFQADNDLRGSIRTGVLRRERAIDFHSSASAGLHGLPDPVVLGLAAMEGRILVSHDENSMPAHLKVFLEAGNRSPGVILASQSVPTGEVIEDLVAKWTASEAEEWADRLVWLPF